MDESRILARVNQLESFNDKRLAKYRRNLNRFANNGMRREDVWNLYGGPQGYWFASNTEEDTGTIPVMNVIKSSVNTHVSKVSQTKVRPFFNPVNASFDTRFTARQAQLFFDDLFERQEVSKIATMCARDADIFEYGAVWVDDETATVRRIAPWEFYVDPAEYNFGLLSDCHVRFRQYPLHNLKAKIPAESRLNADLEQNQAYKVDYRVYYDLLNGKKYHIVNGEIIETRAITYKVAPFATIWYEDPMKGNCSTSMVDNQYTLQQQIDSISQKIAIAMALNPANTVFVPKGSEVKASMVSNQIGAIYEYMPIPGISSPVQVSTPSPISPFYREMLEFYQRQAYEMEGISMLSAQQKKPSGINSGVGLDTLQDVESERHNQFLQSFIRFYMAIASLCVEVFPPEMPILPKQVGRSRLKWKEIKKERDSFTIQFSASSSLSKEPKVKMEQLEKLVSMGIIPQQAVARYMEMPDLESAYGVQTASFDYNVSLIGKAVKGEDYKVNPLTDLQGLYVETINEILRLLTADDKQDYVDRATKLLETVGGLLDGVATQNNPAQPPMPAPEPVAQDTAKTAMNGEQVNALVALAQSVAQGGIDPMVAKAIMKSAFPLVPQELVETIFATQTASVPITTDPTLGGVV